MASQYTQGKNSTELVGLNATLNLWCTMTKKTVIGLLQSIAVLNHHRTILFDNYFTSPELCEKLLYQDSYACGTEHPHQKGLPKAVTSKKTKLKKAEIIYRRKGNMLCLRWFDKRNMIML